MGLNSKRETFEADSLGEVFEKTTKFVNDNKGIYVYSMTSNYDRFLENYFTQIVYEPVEDCNKIDGKVIPTLRTIGNKGVHIHDARVSKNNSGKTEIHDDRGNKVGSQG